MSESLETFGLALIEQGPAFFILAVVLLGIGYALHKGAGWWARKAEVWMERWLGQVDESQKQVNSLIDENRNDRDVYLKSMETLQAKMEKREVEVNAKFDKQDATLDRIEVHIRNMNNGSQ